MRRLLTGLGLLAGLLAGPAELWAADPPFTVYMVQWRGHTATDDGFRDYLATENVPVRIVLRDIDRKVDALPAVIAEIKALRPDLVYVWGLAASAGLLGTLEQVRDHPERYVTDIPVVACTVADPVAAGLSTSWQSTGRNFTGVSHVPPMTAQVNAMRMYDDIKSLAVLYNPTEQSPVTAVAELRRMAAEQGFRLSEHPVPLDGQGMPRADSLPGLIADIAGERAGFLYLGPDSFLAVHNRTVTEEANRRGLPTFSATEIFVRDAPGLAGLVSRYYNVGQ